MSSSDVKFEPRFPSLGPNSDQTGLLQGPNSSCWAHAGISNVSLMLKGLSGLMPSPETNAELDAGPAQLAVPSPGFGEILPRLVPSEAGRSSAPLPSETANPLSPPPGWIPFEAGNHLCLSPRSLPPEEHLGRRETSRDSSLESPTSLSAFGGRKSLVPLLSQNADPLEPPPPNGLDASGGGRKGSHNSPHGVTGSRPSICSRSQDPTKMLPNSEVLA